MAQNFGLTGKTRRGYDTKQVDDFMDRAKAQFETASIPPTLTSSEVRTVGFDVVKHGYRIEEVDEALRRIEGTFAAREREIGVIMLGNEAWAETFREKTATVIARLSRPEGERFRRAPRLHSGYRVKEVDALVTELLALLDSKEPISATKVLDLQSVPFRSAPHGYDELQVDAVIDRVVEIIYATRDVEP